MRVKAVSASNGPENKLQQAPFPPLSLCLHPENELREISCDGVHGDTGTIDYNFNSLNICLAFWELWLFIF